MKPKMYFEVETNEIHCEAANGDDYSLCGVALDQDQTETVEVAGKRITCSDCLGIIRFCRGITGRSLKRVAGAQS